MSILIVDSNLQELTKLKSELESLGYEGVVSALSRDDALRQYGVDSLGKLPSEVELILMDLTLADSEESGFRAGPKQSRSTSRTVLLGLVDKNDPAAIRKAAEAGATDVIGRPAHKDEILLRVRSALTLAAEREAAYTTEVALEAEIHEKDCELEQIVSHNTEVLSLASHELKTPLANLSGLVDHAPDDCCGKAGFNLPGGLTIDPLSFEAGSGQTAQHPADSPFFLVIYCRI